MLSRHLDAKRRLSSHPYLCDANSAEAYSDLSGIDVALLGVGTVAGDITNCFRQFKEELSEKSKALDLAEEVTRVAEEMRSNLKDCGIRPWGALYFPLADVLGRPFVPEPPDVVLQAIGQQRFDSLSRSVRDLARQVHAARIEQLVDIQHVILVGGGARKAFPIWSLLTALNQDGSRRHTLVTDYSTARDVLNVARGMRAQGIGRRVNTLSPA
jgi:hypothetical protein